jgi:uncharacterized protein
MACVEKIVSRAGGRVKAGRERLLIYTRFPQPGKTKTRLIPALGEEGAASTHRAMTEHLLRQARHVAASRRVAIEIWFDGGTEALMQTWLGRDCRYKAQCAGDIGARMARGFTDAFAEGAQRCVLAGCDCPEVTPDLLRTALDALVHHDLVLGPVSDGGYFLIGLRRSAASAASTALFEEIAWSTPVVFAQTVQAARKLGLRTFLLPLLHDVDRPEDLWRWRAVAQAPCGDSDLPLLSVVVPALNEALVLPATLNRVRQGANLEVIVADGGSADRTREVAASLGAAIVRCEKGRGRQMNMAAASARGEALLFLHADTLVPTGYDRLIRAAVCRPHFACGSFSLSIADADRRLQCIARLANYRSRALQLPYGDQGIFVGASLFRALGGFPDVPLMEDFIFVRRAIQFGKVVVLPEFVITSARRWKARGLWRTTALHQAIICAYFTGVPLRQLARMRTE